jgi:hypothetical protein
MAMPAEICAAVGAYLELFPGVAANRANLETLLGHITKKTNYAVPCAPSLTRPRLYFTVIGTELVLDIYEPSLLVVSWREDAAILQRTFAPATPDGLLACIVAGNAALKAAARGLCESCLRLRYPRKMLKAPGSEVCLECAMSAPLGR